MLIDRVVIESEIKIGDTLTALPWLFELARRNPKGLQVTGAFHPLVRAMVGEKLLYFSDEDHGETCVVNVRRAYDYANINHCHIAQGHFCVAGEEPPSLPITLSLTEAACDLAPGVVIHPFTASDEGHTKLWWPDRWLATINHLVERHRMERIYVIGSGADDVSVYEHPNVVVVQDLPLEKLLHLLRRAPLFASVDSGPSHLAHLGGISRHVLMAPAQVAGELAYNPRGRLIHARPADISVDRMIDEIEIILRAHETDDG